VGDPVEFCRGLWQQKTIVPMLSYGIALVIIGLVVSVELSRLVTDRQTDRHMMTALSALA